MITCAERRLPIFGSKKILRTAPFFLPPSSSMLRATLPQFGPEYTDSLVFLLFEAAEHCSPHQRSLLKNLRHWHLNQLFTDMLTAALGSGLNQLQQISHDLRHKQPPNLLQGVFMGCLFSRRSTRAPPAPGQQARPRSACTCASLRAALVAKRARLLGKQTPP